MDLSNGLHAQVFLWTADNRNSHVDFGPITLTVTGRIPGPPAEINADFSQGIGRDFSPFKERDFWSVVTDIDHGLVISKPYDDGSTFGAKMVRRWSPEHAT